jgi:hypothetical protein
MIHQASSFQRGTKKSVLNLRLWSPNKINLKPNDTRGRNQNFKQIDSISQAIRSQSPHLYNPTIQIKYETNNYYQPMVNSPNRNDHNQNQQTCKSPKASNNVIDGSIFNKNATGFMSPKHFAQRAFDFHPTRRVKSPMNMTPKLQNPKNNSVRNPK